jgi:integral membrane protein (TIGR01906 family)
VLVVAVVAFAVPPLLVVNAIRVLATDSFVRAEVDRGGLPPDRYGLTTSERRTLAVLGLRSIQPGSPGIVLLERAELPDGSPAFDSRELRHMGDVRRLLGWALRAQLIVVGAFVVLALALRRSGRWRAVVPRGLLIGALGTLMVAVLAVPLILLGFDDFFLGFHTLFFDGNTWRFSSTDTLLRVYPERFWQHTAEVASALAVGQAILLALGSWFWLRRTGSRVAA